MKLSFLALMLILTAQIAGAQETVSDKNIQQCFKHSVKTPAAFDRCVAEEFARVRDAKELREARIRVGKDPDTGCGEPTAYRECFEELLADIRASSERIHELGGSDRPYPRARFHFYYPRIYPWRYYPTYPRIYIPRFYFPFVPPRHW